MERTVTISGHASGGFLLGKDWAVPGSPREWFAPFLKKDKGLVLGYMNVPCFQTRRCTSAGENRQGVILYMLEPTT